MTGVVTKEYQRHTEYGSGEFILDEQDLCECGDSLEFHEELEDGNERCNGDCCNDEPENRCREFRYTDYEEEPDEEDF